MAIVFHHNRQIYEWRTASQKHKNKTRHSFARQKSKMIRCTLYNRWFDICHSIRYNAIMRCCAHDYNALSPRLAAAFDMLGRAKIVADVGCDHGCLAAAVACEDAAQRVIATDISSASVGKTKALALSLGLSGRIEAFRADGLSGLLPMVEGSPFKIAICGMGGELIAHILEHDIETARRAALVVMQPMRGEAELRLFLREQGFRIEDERVVREGARFYQLIAAAYGSQEAIPDWFPTGFYRFGWVMTQKREAELLPLLLHFRSVYQRELIRAEGFNVQPSALTETIDAVNILIDYLSGGGST